MVIKWLKSKFAGTGTDSAYRISGRRLFAELGILACSGVLMALSFPPANVAFFAWVSVIPLIWLCAGATCKRAFWYGLVWGWFWHVCSTFFLREIMLFIPFVFAVILALFNAVFAALIPFLTKNLLLPFDIRKSDFEVRAKFYAYPAWGELAVTFTLAAFWILLEHLRSWIFTGFPWNLLGVSQWQSDSLIQLCEYTGVYGISFLVILINCAAFFAIHGFRYSLPEGKYKRSYPLIAALIILMCSNAAGLRLYNRAAQWYEQNTAASEALGIGAVQPHLSQRRAGTVEQATEALDQCYMLTRELLDKEQADLIAWRAASPGSDGVAGSSCYIPLQLIVWPETAVPCPYYADVENDHKRQYMTFPAEYRRVVRKLLSEPPHGAVLLGTITTDDSGNTCNSALLLKDKEPAGLMDFKYDQLDVYSKVHLVPYGEFVPLAWKFPQLDQWLGMGRSLTPGSSFRPLAVAPNVEAGVLICYEDVFAYAAREQARNGANMLLVITNDAWYPESSEPEQHYVNSIFRTVETRLPMVRVGNSSHTVYISPLGRLEDAVDKEDPAYRKSGVAKFNVRFPLHPEPTFYTVYGDVFVLLCGFVFLIGAGIAVFRHYLFYREINDPLEAERNRIRENFLNSGADKKK